MEDSVELQKLSEESLLASDEQESENHVELFEDSQVEIQLSGTELDSYESGEIEEVEFLEDSQVMSILESMLFATEKPQSLNTLKQPFKGTNIKTQKIKQCLELLQIEYASAVRGVELEFVNGGYQLRTKVDNQPFLKRLIKGRPFRLTGPALETLSIIAYKQPCIKLHVDEIRGVESGHLVRALMEKGLVHFAGKSELPGKPMLYQTSKKFLEIFSLRNIKELPSLTEIDELIPEGIGEEEPEKETLDMVSDTMGKDPIEKFSESEEELEKITDKLSNISISSEFFEQEKRREKQRRDAERAQDIREAMMLEEEIPTKDTNWLKRYDEAQALTLEEAKISDEVLEVVKVEDNTEETDELSLALEDINLSMEPVAQEDDSTLELLDDDSEPPLEVESTDLDDPKEAEASPALLDALAQFDKDDSSEENNNETESLKTIDDVDLEMEESPILIADKDVDL